MERYSEMRQYDNDLFDLEGEFGHYSEMFIVMRGRDQIDVTHIFQQINTHTRQPDIEGLLK